MTALAARAMGYRIHVLDPDAECSAAPVSDRVVAARFDDVESARELARGCDVVTLEIEQIATSVLEACADYAPTRPNATVIGIIQDRGRQKAWLRNHGFPLGDYRDVTSGDDLAAAIASFGACYVKATRGGYDGRSQVRIGAVSEAAGAWEALGRRPAVAERALELAGELSVMVARRPSGAIAVFPAALNHHERQVLSWSVIPAPIDRPIVERATDIGRAIADQLQIEGLLAIEMFLTSAGDVLVNELAPRPHNSFHATERACATSQFEQLARAVCDIPLGDTSVLRPAAIVNLFGDLWRDGKPPNFALALEDPGVRVHLYGKPGPRPGRKMGHISAIGGSTFDALDAVRGAARRVGTVTEDIPDSLRAFGVRR